MPLDPSIPLSFRFPQIESPLAQYGQMVQIQQAMQQQEAARRKLAQDEQYRAAMAALPSDATEEQQLQAARPFQGPEQLGQQITASRDRKALMALKAADFATQMEERRADRERKHLEFQERQADQ